MMDSQETTMEKPAARYFTTVDRCSCPDFRFRGRQRPCKHVLALRTALDVLTPTGASGPA